MLVVDTQECIRVNFAGGAQSVRTHHPPFGGCTTVPRMSIQSSQNQQGNTYPVATVFRRVGVVVDEAALQEHTLLWENIDGVACAHPIQFRTHPRPIVAPRIDSIFNGGRSNTGPRAHTLLFDSNVMVQRIWTEVIFSVAVRVRLASE